MHLFDLGTVEIIPAAKAALLARHQGGDRDGVEEKYRIILAPRGTSVAEQEET